MGEKFVGIKFRGWAMLKVSRVLNFVIDPKSAKTAKFSTREIVYL